MEVFKDVDPQVFYPYCTPISSIWERTLKCYREDVIFWMANQKETDIGHIYNIVSIHVPALANMYEIKKGLRYLGVIQTANYFPGIGSIAHMSNVDHHSPYTSLLAVLKHELRCTLGAGYIEELYGEINDIINTLVALGADTTDLMNQGLIELR
jgi:hypothetical protein